MNIHDDNDNHDDVEKQAFMGALREIKIFECEKYS